MGVDYSNLRYDSAENLKLEIGNWGEMNVYDL
jgi:hypothetical protein